MDPMAFLGAGQQLGNTPPKGGQIMIGNGKIVSRLQM